MKCHHCAKCYWLTDAEKIGTFSSWRGAEQTVDPTWIAAEAVQPPGEGEYYNAIAMGLGVNPKQARNLRILAWWRSNDVFRDASADGTEGVLPLSAAARDNLNALATLLRDGDSSDGILRAEVQRELGEFDAAIGLLTTITASEHADVVQQIRALCESKDTLVRELVRKDSRPNRSGTSSRRET